MLVLVFEFAISAIVLLGSGLLIYHLPDNEFVKTLVNTAIPMVLTYWFVRRTADRMTDRVAPDRQPANAEYSVPDSEQAFYQASQAQPVNSSLDQVVRPSVKARDNQ